MLDGCKKLQLSTQRVTQVRHRLPELVLAIVRGLSLRCSASRRPVACKVNVLTTGCPRRLATATLHSRVRSASSTSTAHLFPNPAPTPDLQKVSRKGVGASSHKLPQVALTSTEWLNLSTARSVDSGRVPRDPIPKCSLPTSHTLMQHSVCNFWVLPSLLQHFPLCGSSSFSFASMSLCYFSLSFFCRHDIGVQILADVNVTLHEAAERSVVDSAGSFTGETWLEQHFRATETLGANSDVSV